MSYAQTYLKAAELIDRRGLHKGGMSDGHGRYCMAGALCHLDPDELAWARVEHISGEHVIGHNDAADTRKEHAVLFFCLLAAMEANRE